LRRERVVIRFGVRPARCQCRFPLFPVRIRPKGGHSRRICECAGKVLSGFALPKIDERGIAALPGRPRIGPGPTGRGNRQRLRSVFLSAAARGVAPAPSSIAPGGALPRPAGLREAISRSTALERSLPEIRGANHCLLARLFDRRTQGIGIFYGGGMSCG
jgi:hypothetical protein